MGELATLATRDGSLSSAFEGGERAQLETDTLPQFLPGQRWFGAKDQAIADITLVPLGELEPGGHALIAMDVTLGSEIQRYLLPVSAVWGGDGSGETTPVLARIRDGDRTGVLIDGALDKRLASALIEAMRRQEHLAAKDGEVVFQGTQTLRSIQALPEPRPLGAEQSNVSIAFGNSVILKLYRRLRAGEQPDVEVARFLSDVGQFANTPEFLGEIQHRPNAGEPTTLAAAFAFVPNQGDAWSAVTAALTQDLLAIGAASADGAEFPPAAMLGAVLGRRTAEMHKALAAVTTNSEFAVEPLTSAEVALWSREATDEAETLLGRLQAGLGNLPPSARTIAEEILGGRQRLLERLRAGTSMNPSGGRSRIHGDYHLGQVLVTGDDVMIIDFEGEPKRSLPERRAKSSPLRDVAGMLRSFQYAAWTALNRANQAPMTDPARIRSRAQLWSERVTRDFLQEYEQHIGDAPSYPSDRKFARALTELFLLQKAIYEIGYELANRPDWVEIPLTGVRDLLRQT